MKRLPHRAQRGTASLEQLCVLVLVAVAGVVGLTSFGDAAGVSIGGDATSSNAASVTSNAIVVSRQAGVVGEGARIVAQTQDEAAAARSAMKMARKTVSLNGFETGRALRGPYVSGTIDSPYEAYLGSDFVDSLTRLKAGDGWMDMGSGDGAAASEFLHTFHGASPGEAPNVTAVAYAHADTTALERTFPTFRGLYGRYLETIPDRTLGRAKVISDLFGPLSYTTQFDRVLQRYGDMLEVGGEVYAYLGFRSHLPLDPSGVARTDRPDHGLARIQGTEFLRALGERLVGLRIEGEVGKPQLFDGAKSARLKLTKTAETVVVPELKLHTFLADSPPVREYSFVLPN